MSKSDHQDEPLQRQIDNLRRQLRDLEEHGGFPDIKLLQRRFEFIEQRLEALEKLTSGLLEVVSSASSAMKVHLALRHGASSDLNDNKPDTILVRKARHQLVQLQPNLRPPNETSAPSVRD